MITRSKAQYKTINRLRSPNSRIIHIKCSYYSPINRNLYCRCHGFITTCEQIQIITACSCRNLPSYRTQIFRITLTQVSHTSQVAGLVYRKVFPVLQINHTNHLQVCFNHVNFATIKIPNFFIRQLGLEETNTRQIGSNGFVIHICANNRFSLRIPYEFGSHGLFFNEFTILIQANLFAFYSEHIVSQNATSHSCLLKDKLLTRIFKEQIMGIA